MGSMSSQPIETEIPDCAHDQQTEYTVAAFQHLRQAAQQADGRATEFHIRQASQYLLGEFE